MNQRSSGLEQMRSWVADAPVTVDLTQPEQDEWMRRVAGEMLDRYPGEGELILAKGYDAAIGSRREPLSVVPPNERASSFAQLIDALDEESWARLAAQVPLVIADREPIELEAYDGVTADDLRDAARGPGRPMAFTGGESWDK